jgi:hypothetical protein
MPNVSHSGNNHKESRSSSRPYINCKVWSIDDDNKAVDLNNRPKLFLSYSLSICSDLTDDGKLGYGFLSADELEEIDIGPGDKPRPTFISKKLDSSLREPIIALLKEYSDCFPGITRRCLDWIEASSPSQERISAISAMSTSNEDQSLRGGQERDRENTGGRVHQAV